MAKVSDTIKMIEFLKTKLSEEDLKIAAQMILKTCEEFNDQKIRNQINQYSEN